MAAVRQRANMMAAMEDENKSFCYMRKKQVKTRGHINFSRHIRGYLPYCSVEQGGLLPL